ncbi:MAG: prepilin peptidase [Proteobacteria bacterium]|nr:prepilin peptidase [Pseudomonadota bacterium]
MNETLPAIMPVLYVFCTLFAACLGSFSNVVIYRVPNHLSIAWPPSHCPKCDARIKPYDNIPVLSWLILRGKCRNCKAPISPQYVIIEAVCALFGFFLCRQIFEPNLAYLLLDGVFWRLMLLFASMSIFVVGSLALAVMDLKTTELPPEVALPIGAIGLLTAFVIPESWPYSAVMGNVSGMDALLGGLIGGGIVVTIIGVYYLLTKRIGMGGGDIWMMVMVGACLGWECLPFIFLASSLQGIIAAVIAIALGKKQQTKEQQGLFRNQVVAEVEAELLKKDNKETAENADAPKKANAETPENSSAEAIENADAPKETNAETPETSSAEATENADAPKETNAETPENSSAEATENAEAPKDTKAETPENSSAEATEKAEDADEPETGKLAVPFGPFIALAAIEYVFFGKFLLPLISGGMLTPWGFVVF